MVNESQVRSGLAIATLVAVAQCLPLWDAYWFDSHEYWAYVLRVVEFEAALRQGDFYPRWASDFYGGYGSPFFVFYAPLVFAGASVCSALLGSAVLGLKVWIVLASIATGIGAYLAVKAETQRPDAALLASLVYLAAPYRLSNLYVRGDLAEYTALAILPWACWAYREVARALTPEVAARRGVLAVALHAALLLTHAITGLWGTFLLIVLGAATTYQLWQRRAHRHIWLHWVSFALALALAAVYIGPALLQKSYVHIAIATKGYYQPINQLLPLAALTKGQFGVLPSVGVALLLSLAALGLRRGFVAPLLWALAAATYALLSTQYAETFWSLKLPLTSFIQFPWRLHGFAALAAAIALGLSWSALFRASAWREPAVLLMGATALLMTAPMCKLTRPLAQGKFPETTSEIRAGIHHTTADEYLPRWVPGGPGSPSRELMASTPQLTVEHSWSQGSQHELELVAREPQTAELTLHMFPGWQVKTLKGPEPASIVRSPTTGLVSLRLPQAGSYRVQLSFGASPARAAFGFLSLFALLATWPLLWFIASGRALPRVTRRVEIATGAEVTA